MNPDRLVAIPCYLGATVPFAFQRGAVASDWWRAHLGFVRPVLDPVYWPDPAVFAAPMVVVTAYLTVQSVRRPRLAWAWLLLPCYVLWFLAGLPPVWRA